MTCGEFFRFRHAELGLAGVGDDLAQDVAQVVRGEQHAEERCQRVGIAGHADRGGEFYDMLAGEAVEGRVQQGGEEFANPVGAEVEAQDGVAVLHAGVVADDRGGDELVELSGGVGGLDGGFGGGDVGAFGVRDGGVGLGDAVPALVAVHREVAADDGGDRHARGQCGLQAGQVVGGGLRRGVAAVGDRVDDGFAAGVVQVCGQRGGMVLMRMHAAGRDESDQVAGSAGLFQGFDQGGEGGRCGDAAVRDGVADAHQFLLHHAAGADVQVADLGVAHLARRQPDIAAGCVQEGVRAGLPQAGEGWGLRQAHGVVRAVLTPAEAVEDHQHYRSDRHACSSLCLPRP